MASALTPRTGNVNGSNVNANVGANGNVNAAEIAGTTYRPIPSRTKSITSINTLSASLTSLNGAANADGSGDELVLELSDGSIYRGRSFGAKASVKGGGVSGECVFQTGASLTLIFVHVYAHVTLLNGWFGYF
jgi:hypothetical protein